MKVAIIGTGYVGLPTGIGLAELGNDVICIDKDAGKIETLKSGKATIFEEGLEELFAKNLQSGKLKFTTSMGEGVKGADLVLIAVGTPPHPVTKEADMKYIHAAANELAEHLIGYTVIATKSTVPVGTGDAVEEIIKTKNAKADFDVVSLPEFLREGFALHDFFNPDRIVVGANSDRAIKVIKDLYSHFEGKTKILFVHRRSSETIKYAANAFLAIKIHYINEMADFCEKAGADIYEVAQGMGLDSRIGHKFLNPGPGYGGSCFPKDTNAMAFMGRQNDVDLSLIETAIKGNDARKNKMADRIVKHLKDKQGKIAALGLAFKNGTDDCRDSPAIQIINALLEKGAEISAYDPKSMANAKDILGDKVAYAATAEEAAKGADVIAILTEWEDFKALDWAKIATLAKGKTIVDLRNILDPHALRSLGFTYFGVGR